MGIATCLDAPLNCIPHRPLISRIHLVRSFIVCSRRQPQITRKNSLKHKWEDSSIKHNFSAFNIKVHASPGDSNDIPSEIYEDGAPSISELEQAKVSLSEAKSRREEIEKERDQLIEGLARSEAVQQEYAATVKHDKDLACQELEAAKSLFDEKLRKSVEEKIALESKLVIAKEDAVGLAVQVEKLAELAFQQATSQIIKDAQLRVSAAETNAAEAAHHAEEQIRNTAEGAISSIIEQSTNIINKALFAAEQATTHAKNAVTAITGGENLMDEISAVRSENIRLENAISDLESHLLISKTEVDKMKAKLDQAIAQCKASDLRATSTEEALANHQELSRKKDLQREENFKFVLEKMKKEAAERDEAAANGIKVELQSIMDAVEAAKKTAQLKDQAYIKRCAALERSLKASQAASEVWRQRAETAESILQKQSSSEEEIVEYANSGGRINLLTNSDSQKWKLLAEGPRRELPEWMARRIVTIGHKFPPRKVNISKVLAAETLSLNLPKADEVWSIAQEKLTETDLQVERVIEKEAIEKKRKALERSLERKTVKIEKTPEEIKLEPGTGTGREIVVRISLESLQYTRANN